MKNIIKDFLHRVSNGVISLSELSSWIYLASYVLALALGYVVVTALDIKI